MKNIFLNFALSATFFAGFSAKVHALAPFPNVCSVVKTPDFHDCLDLSVKPSMCGWPIPRPCVHFSYYIPETFVESVSNAKETFFSRLPGTRAQLLALPRKMLPFGAEDDEGAYSSHAHALTIPFVNIPFRAMPCGDVPIERWCFEAMSEHMDLHWRTGKADLLQPSYLAWKLAPKACLLYGEANSLGGEVETAGGAAPGCSVPVLLPTFPPSPRSMCNGWGTFFPRYGTYDGSSQTVGALMIADRLKNLGTEVFRTVSSSSDEKWQIITPTQSACFRRGQNVGYLEAGKLVTDVGRPFSGHPKNHLFAVWKRVSCTRDIPAIATTRAAVAIMNTVCRGL